MEIIFGYVPLIIQVNYKYQVPGKRPIFIQMLKIKKKKNAGNYLRLCPADYAGEVYILNPEEEAKLDSQGTEDKKE